MSNSSSTRNAAPAEPPNLILLRKFLDDYHADVLCVFHDGKHDPDYMKYQINLYHTSRLFSVGFKRSIGGHGPDADVLAGQILDSLKASYEKELESQVDYVTLLNNYVDENFNDGIYVFSEDRYERARVPGRRFKVWVELDKNSDEFKRCGLKEWIFAEGYGRDNQQAAHNALEMLSLKMRKDLLWINEADGEVNYFKEKELQKLRKEMKGKGKDVPNCHKPRSDPPDLQKSGSTLSMKSFFKLPPFGTHTAEKANFVDPGDSTGSSKNITASRNNKTSLFSRSRKPSHDNLNQTSESAGTVGTSKRGDPIPKKEGSKAQTQPATKGKKGKELGGEEKARQGSENSTSSRATPKKEQMSEKKAGKQKDESTTGGRHA